MRIPSDISTQIHTYMVRNIATHLIFLIRPKPNCGPQVTYQCAQVPVPVQRPEVRCWAYNRY